MKSSVTVLFLPPAFDGARAVLSGLIWEWRINGAACTAHTVPRQPGLVRGYSCRGADRQAALILLSRLAVSLSGKHVLCTMVLGAYGLSRRCAAKRILIEVSVTPHRRKMGGHPFIASRPPLAIKVGRAEVGDTAI